MAFPIHPENRSALLLFWPLQLTAKVEISSIQRVCIDIGVNRAVRDWQFIPVLFTSGRKGFPLLQQRGNGIIDPVPVSSEWFLCGTLRESFHIIPRRISCHRTYGTGSSGANGYRNCRQREISHSQNRTPPDTPGSPSGILCRQSATGAFCGGRQSGSPGAWYRSYSRCSYFR